MIMRELEKEKEFQVKCLIYSEGHNQIRTVWFHQEDITILNMCATNKIGSKHVN